MDFSIVTEYPLWFLVVCILAGIAYAAILYYRELKNEFTDSLKWTLAVLRSVTVALISFLLLNPMIKTSAHHAEKPIIVFAQDNSMSLVTGRDSAFYRQDYPSTVNSLLDRISASCRLDRYTFGEKPDKSFNLDFSEKLTDISGLFQAINDRYAGQNVGALILATDGIYNKGINPLYAVDKFKFPVYTVALGDTNVNRDVILFKVNYNRIAYLDNEFPLEVIIKADKLMNFTTELTISREDTVLFSKLINITSENFFETVNLHLKANESGLQRYSLRLRGAKDEVSTENNFQDIFIDILEDRQKILILAQSPHPDISAIKQAFASNKNYTIENYLIDEFDKEVKGYNLIIFHNLPSAANNLSDFTELILRDRIPVLYIIGKQTNLSYLNWQNSGFQLREDQVLINEAAPVFNDRFASFNLSQTTRQAIPGFPPLVSPYGNIDIQPSVNILMYQKIGHVITGEPLIAFNESAESKTGIILGNGIWKWRLTDYLKEGNHFAFDEVIDKIIQYLSVKQDKSLFRVYSKNNFNENENVEFTAEVYNENYELVLNPDVTISILDSQKKSYAYTFTNGDSICFLDAGRFPVDRYSYSARVQVGDKIYTDKGEFTVSPLTIEKINTVADHNLLYNIALRSGGLMMYASNLNELSEVILTNDQIKTISYTNKLYREILNLPALLILLITLLTAEWFIRKRAGAY